MQITTAENTHSRRPAPGACKNSRNKHRCHQGGRRPRDEHQQRRCKQYPCPVLQPLKPYDAIETGGHEHAERHCKTCPDITGGKKPLKETLAYAQRHYSSTSGRSPSPADHPDGNLDNNRNYDQECQRKNRCVYKVYLEQFQKRHHD
jgi:hypothetical protein